MMNVAGDSRKTDVFKGFPRTFDVRWLRLDDLDFSEVSFICNPWNENKSVKISRDGQELPNDVGRRVCEMIDERVWRKDTEGYAADGNEVETGGFMGAGAVASAAGGGCGASAAQYSRGAGAGPRSSMSV